MKDSLDRHLEKKFKKNKNFKKKFNDEFEILKLSYKIQGKRNKLGLSQQELAKKAHVTQQQLSSIENGSNFTIKTFLRINKALGLKFNYK